MQPQRPNARRHDIDALRVGAFALLILYHVGMFYVSWGWHVKSAYQSEELEFFMGIVNPWRMPLLFMISGLAVHFLLGKVTSGQFAWQRLKRLGIPLLFGMAVVIPPQAYLEALSNDAFRGDYGAFLIRYFTFQPWPRDAFAGSDIGVTWNHLWYLPYLLFYTLVGIPLYRWLEGRGAGLRGRCLRLRGVSLMVVPLMPLLVWGTFVYPSFPYISHAFLDDWYAHAMFFTFFLYGHLIGRDAGLWSELARMRRLTLALAVTLFFLRRFFAEILPDQTTDLESFGYMIVIYGNRWLWLMTVLGWGHALLNRPFRWLPYATEAVYPWYILHQTITVVAGYQLSKWALGPVLEPVLLVTITIGGCLVLHEYAIRRVGFLRPLFGLKPVHRSGRGSVPLSLQASERA
jgi:hypothetical protein